MSTHSLDDQAALAAVERSLPNPHRPRLSDRDEQRFALVDRKSALAYADAELAIESLEALASDGIPDEELLGDTTLVTLIDELHAVAANAQEEEP